MAPQRTKGASSTVNFTSPTATSNAKGQPTAKHTIKKATKAPAAPKTWKTSEVVKAPKTWTPEELAKDAAKEAKQLATTMKKSKKAFPMLEEKGLYAAAILNEGDCLFMAVSDQMYGTPDNHFEIRNKAVDYVADNLAHFEAFIAVTAGGGEVRNARRAVRGIDTTETTEAQRAKTTENYLKTMRQSGKYGDNIMISAIARCYGINIINHNTDWIATTPAVDNEEEAKNYRSIHIAYHGIGHEHYSSVRKITGPHKGLPLIESADEVTTPQKRQRDTGDVTETPSITATIEAHPQVPIATKKRKSASADDLPPLKKSKSSDPESSPDISAPATPVTSAAVAKVEIEGEIDQLGGCESPLKKSFKEDAKGGVKTGTEIQFTAKKIGEKN